MMNPIFEPLVDVLHRERCSLVVQDAGGLLHTYIAPGVRDLEHMLKHEPQVLQGAVIADKVIGKAAAGLALSGGVSAIYGQVMSRKALPVLKAAGITYDWGALVDHIIIPAGDNRCPLEQIVAQAETPQEITQALFTHFQKQ